MRRRTGHVSGEKGRRPLMSKRPKTRATSSHRPLASHQPPSHLREVALPISTARGPAHPKRLVAHPATSTGRGGAAMPQPVECLCVSKRRPSLACPTRLYEIAAHAGIHRPRHWRQPAPGGTIATRDWPPVAESQEGGSEQVSRKGKEQPRTRRPGERHCFPPRWRA